MLRRRRRAHRNAGLQPVHGQPGAGARRRHRVSRPRTRNFPNRLGKNTNVYLGSAELAAICSKLGRIPTVAEYQADMGVHQRRRRQGLPVPELRPDRRVRRGGPRADPALIPPRAPDGDGCRACPRVRRRLLAIPVPCGRCQRRPPALDALGNADVRRSPRGGATPRDSSRRNSNRTQTESNPMKVTIRFGSSSRIAPRFRRHRQVSTRCPRSRRPASGKRLAPAGVDPHRARSRCCATATARR